jgi:hypothetical protein
MRLVQMNVAQTGFRVAFHCNGCGSALRQDTVFVDRQPVHGFRAYCHSCTTAINRPVPARPARRVTA